MKLSPHFSLEEFTRSMTATRLGIENKPGPMAISRMQNLCLNVLEPLRDAVALPISITSGFRCKKLNAAIGGSETSQHMKGEAADFEIPGMSNLDVIREIVRLQLEYDQLIYEFGATGWIHTSHAQNNRGQILKAERKAGKTVYSVLHL